MINLSNIIENGNNAWGYEENNDFVVGNQNYTNMLDLTNQVSSKKILLPNDLYRDDTFNDRDDNMGFFDNSKDMRNFSGNFSNRGNGFCNISGFLNMTNNQSLNLGGTLKYAKKSNKSKKGYRDNRNQIFENALSIEDNIEGLDQAISNISHISMRSDNRDTKKKAKKKSKTSYTAFKSKQSKQSNQKYQN